MEKKSGGKPVIVFGGSFDPPHRAHVLLLEKALSELKPEKIIIVPAYRSPFKNCHYSPFRHRKAMLKKILAGSPAGKASAISDFENRRKKRTYAFQITDAFSRRRRGEKIFFLMGSDAFNSFHRWKKPFRILEKAVPLVGERKGFATPAGLKKKIGAVFLKGVFPAVSSTKTREEIFSGNSGALAPELRNYAGLHNLYNYRLSDAVRRLVSPARFSHTAGTARLALRLARVHGVDEVSASAAALLHDCAKELPLKKQAELAKKAGLPGKEAENILEKAPGIMHQWAGAALAKGRFGIKDGNILSAIASHSSSHKKMSKLAKLIYVADFAGYERRFRAAGRIRALALKDLEKAYRETLALKKGHLKKIGKWIYE